MSDDRPSIYCGTYAKYNSGSIAGRWLALEDYADADAFLAACRALHADESDPELMFQDFQCFPQGVLFGIARQGEARGAVRMASP